MAEQRKKLRLGELLVQQGLITSDQLAIALAEQRNNNIPIGRLLVRLRFVTKTSIRDIMARTAGTALSTAVTLEPRNVDYLVALGDHYLKRGRGRDALAVADLLIAAAPDQPMGQQLMAAAEQVLAQGGTR